MALKYSSSPATDYRPEIDGLRALAVLCVVFFHFGWQGFSGGFVGVDVFFVISGFLITRLIVNEIAATGTFRFLDFYLRRIRRLFPALAAVLAVSSIAAFFILSPAHFSLFGEELISATLSVSNIYYFDEADYFDVSKHFKALLHTWSLGVEEQFYLLWPVLLLLCLRRSNRVLVFTLAALAAASLLFAQFLPDRDAAFFLTPFRVFEFAAGAALVWLMPYRLPAKLQEMLLLAGLVLIGVAVHFYSESTHLPGLLSLVPVIGAMLCIHCGSAPLTGWLLRNPASVAVGKISYSLYLVHWPLVVFASYAAPEFSMTDRAALVVGSLLLATLLHVFIEQPLRHARPTGRGGNATFIRGGLAVIIACVLLGTAMSRGDGWGWRLPDDAYSLLASAKRETQLRNPCHYDAEAADSDFEERFRKCVASSGPAVLVVGDSHAGDLFPALAVNSGRPHIAGVWEGGCRPFNPKRNCPYDSIVDFVARNSASIAAIVYTQKGSYLLTDTRELPVLEDAIDRTIDYLRSLQVPGVPLLWVGPHWEPGFSIDETPPFRAERHQPYYFRDQNMHVVDVNKAISDALLRRHASIQFVSLIDILGPLTVADYIVGGEYTYADEDHWSAKGEEVFGARLLARSALLQQFLKPVSPGAGNSGATGTGRGA